ncbi:MAG: divalent-cation tolerance protein CutA [Methylophilaceae bacterium]|jgi:periplasmic divalent cation tolerance protein|nr:MAG: divalent-cation tolerance protein CutA [Methylophilaceae bacterium]
MSKHRISKQPIVDKNKGKKNNSIVVLVHVPDLDCAKHIANALITAKLAACVNIGAACQSVYEWQGTIETQTEFPLEIKTHQRCYQAVEALILEMHPYELPGIIALNVHGGYHAYLQWVSAQLSIG